jgi:aminoglycoside phosphotransferase
VSIPSRVDSGPARTIAATGLDATGRNGTPASEPEYRFDVESTVAMLARTLASLHDHRVAGADGIAVLTPDGIVAEVRSSVRDGALCSESLSAAYRHMPIERLVQILDDTRPPSPTPPEAASAAPGDAPSRSATSKDASGVGPLVPTHGRPSLDRLHGKGGAPLGFVGWERFALADPYRDLAVAARSVANDLGPMLVPALFDHYFAARQPGGFGTPDPVRLDWYALAAELSP